MRKSVKISFQRNKISRNAVITMVTGAVTLAGFVLLILISAVSGGNLSMTGGLLGCLFGILSVFGVLWGIVSYDDVRTSQKFKIPGIVLNIMSVFLAITLFMFH